MRKRMLRSFATILLASVFIMLPFASTAQQQGTTRYVYDEKGRIQAVISPTGEATVYEYDQAGNIVSVSRRMMNVTSIVGFSPILGAVGSSVTIYGTGFSANAGENIVTFNGSAAAVVSASSTELAVTVPVGATDGPISVTSPSGSATSSTIFRVLTPIITGFSPVVGPPGSTVHLTGRNFANNNVDNVVKFNGVNAEIVSATDLEITARVPDGARSGKISVTTPHGTGQTSGDFFVSPSGYTSDMVEVTGRIAFGESKRITLTSPDKVGILIFDGAADQRMRIRMSQAELESYQVSVYDPTQGAITFFAGDTAGGFTDAVPLPENNTYAILVVPTNDHTGALTLSLFDEAAASTIVPGGPAVHLTVAPPARDAYAVFDAVAGQRVSLRLDGVTIPGGTVYYYKPGGYVLTSQALATGDSFIDTLTVPATGRYTIFIEPQPNAIGAATLTLYNVVDVTGVVTLDGPPVDFTTTVPGQNARITFYAEAGDGPTLSLSNVTLPGDSVITVYSYDVQQPLVPPVAVSASGGTISVGEITESRYYTILIDPQGAITGGMTLSLNRPIDVTGTLVIDGPPVTVPIPFIGQNARFTFAGETGQRITLNATAVTIPYSSISIFRPDGTLLIQPIVVDTAGRSIGNIKLPATGTYTVFIDPNGGATGSMTLELITATGIIVPDGPPVTVNLTTPGESQSLTFSGTAGQRVSLQLSEISVYSGTIAINKPDGTPLVPTRFFYESGFIDATLLPVSGTYSIVLTAPDDQVGSLTLQLYDASEVIGTITPGGGPVTVTMPTPGQNARFTFNGVAGQRVYLNTGQQTVQVLDLSVLAPDGTVLATTNIYSGGNDFFEGFNSSRYIDTLTLPVNGVYTVYVDPNYNFTGSIALTLYDVPADLTGSITPDGPPVTVSINAPGQNARLSFPGTTGQRMLVQVVDNTIGQTELGFYNPDGTSGEHATVFRGQGGVVESGQLLADGTYTLLLDPGANNLGDITVRLMTVPDDVTAEITIGGPPVTVTTTAPGQNARLTLTATAGQKISFAINNVTFPLAYAFMYDPNGAQVFYGSYLYAGGSIFYETVTLPLTGQYTILLNPDREYTGSARVTLGDVSDVLGTIEVNGPPVTITTTVPGQRGVLSFNGVAGQWLRMTVISTTVPKTNQYAPPSWVSIHPPGSDSGLGSNGNFHNIVDTQPLPVDGTYTISVDPLNSATGSTTISLAEVPPVGSIEIDGPSVSLVTHAYQISHLTFEGTAGQRVSLKASNFWGTHVWLYGSDLTLLGEASGSSFFSGAAFVDVVTLPSSGTYHVAVTSLGSSDGSDHITVNLYSVTDITGTIAIGGPPVPITFVTPGQKARLTYEYDGVEEKRVGLNITNVTFPYGSVSIDRDDGNHIFSNYTFGTEGTFIEFTQTSGTYTILIDPEGANTGDGTVSLVEPAPDVTAVVEVNGPPQTLALTTPGQKAIATFTASAGQIVSVSTNVSGTAHCFPIYLWSPTGNYVNSVYTCSNGVFDFSGMSLPEDGVYRLEMDPSFGSMGTFVVTVRSP